MKTITIRVPDAIYQELMSANDARELTLFQLCMLAAAASMGLSKDEEHEADNQDLKRLQAENRRLREALTGDEKHKDGGPRWIWGEATHNERPVPKCSVCGHAVAMNAIRVHERACWSDE